MKDIKLGVVGYGTMGRGIVTSALLGGLGVKVLERGEELLRDGHAAVLKNIAKAIEKGKASGNPEEYLRNCVGVKSVADLADRDIIIEAVFEDREIKAKLFAEMDKALPAGVVFATNTSSLSVSGIAANTNRADKVIGMHFMNPVPLMQLVEVVRGAETSGDTIAAIKDLARQMGKITVDVKDSPGFVVNRLLIPMINEACSLLHEGVADAEAIDTVMKLGANHPIGPLALADLIGLDVVLSIMDVIEGGLNSSKYNACPLLRQKVEAGHLGRKTGEGFYKYNQPVEPTHKEQA